MFERAEGLRRVLDVDIWAKVKDFVILGSVRLTIGPSSPKHSRSRSPEQFSEQIRKEVYP